MSDDEISLFEVGASLVRHRWSIVRWAVAGVVVFVAFTFSGKPKFTTFASFMPQQAEDPGRSGLASLAGQFGFRVGGGGAETNSPDFYSDLIKAHVILAPIVADSFVVPEISPARQSLLDLLQVRGTPESRRLDLGVMKLQSMEQISVTQKTGVVRVAIATNWPSLSAALVQRLLDGVNAFNLKTRQSQASQERKFTETRLAEARMALRASEDRLQTFLQQNREFLSPQLKFDKERLDRDVNLNQQVVSSLAQANEEVRIREVRNTPVISVIEPPVLANIPDGRGRTVRALVGLLIGTGIGVLLSLMRDMSRHWRRTGNPDATEFFGVLDEAKGQVGRLIPGGGRHKSNE